MANIRENQLPEKTSVDLTNTDVRVLESGASQQMDANTFLSTVDASIAKRSKERVLNVSKEAFTTVSDKKAVSSEGNLGAGIKMQFAGIDKKAILTHDCGVKSTDEEAWMFPFKNCMADSNGLGQLSWLVAHFYLNKGKPVGGGTIAGNRQIITTDNITTATGTNHVITKVAHGFTNGQDVVPWCFSGHDTITASRFRGMAHSMGKTLYVEVLSDDTFRLHRNSGLTNPLSLLTANFPTAGTSGTVTYASNVTASGTYAQTSVSKTVSERNHGYAVGDRAETPDGDYTVATVPNAHSFTYVYDEVTVTNNAHGLTNGQWIYFDATSGSALDGWYRIFDVTTNTFKFKPFTPLNTSGNCTYSLPLVVTDTAHGIATGDFVRLAPTTGNLPTDVYVVTRINANSYSIMPINQTGAIATTGGSANVRRNMFAVCVDAWDVHGHTSMETAWRDGTVNTMFGWTYGLNYPLLRFNGLIAHWSGCRWQFTGEAGTNVDMELGRDHEDPYFALRLNSANNLDVVAFDSNYTATTPVRVFRNTGNIQIGGGNTDHGGQLASRSATALRNLTALVDESSSPAIVYHEQIGRLVTTNDTQSTLWSFTLGTGNINIASIKARITVMDTTNEGSGTPEIELGEFDVTASARRRSVPSGSTALKGSTVTAQNNTTALTTSNIIVDVSGGAIRIRVTGENAKTYRWRAKVELTTYTTP